jgi:hypothetical protein
MQLAPWIQPTNVIGAMQAGANLGLQVRHQNEEEQSAADALKLHQDQLFAENQRASEAQQEKHGEAAARLAQASAQMALMAGHYKDAKEIQTAAQAITKSHYDAMAGVAERHQKMLEDKADESDPESFQAKPVVMPDGTISGYRVAGSRGASHPIPGLSAPKTFTPTPASLHSFLTTLDTADKSPDITDEEKANHAAQRRTALEELTRLTLPNLKPLVPQVTPGGMFRSPVTNWVPGSDTNSLAPNSVVPASKSRVTIANALAIQHPDWDRPKVISETEKVFSGGQ